MHIHFVLVMLQRLHHALVESLLAVNKFNQNIVFNIHLYMHLVPTVERMNCFNSSCHRAAINVPITLLYDTKAHGEPALTEGALCFFLGT